jgi:hypothetical protein
MSSTSDKTVTPGAAHSDKLVLSNTNLLVDIRFDSPDNAFISNTARAMPAAGDTAQKFYNISIFKPA